MRVLRLPDKEYQKEFIIEDDPSKTRSIRKEAATNDILYFIERLGKDRNARYIDQGSPDDKCRNDASADRLVQDREAGNKIAIEHAELWESQQYVKTLDYEIRKNGWTSGPPPSPRQLAARLIQIIHEKKDKNQFKNYPSYEKILLLRDRCTSGRIKDFLECTKYLVRPDDAGCDHCYVLLSSGAVLEIF